MRSLHIESAELNKLIDKNIQLIQGVTVSSRQLSDFYSAEHKSFGGIAAEAIAETTENFFRPAPQPRMDAVGDALGSESW